jgi:hypothetical protein
MIKEIRFCLNADEAPSLLGAYAMATELTDKAAMMLSGRLPIARPGGLKARLSRHMRRGKSVRWYVDQLTERVL